MSSYELLWGLVIFNTFVSILFLIGLLMLAFGDDK